jgi:hypothetical protein
VRVQQEMMSTLPEIFLFPLSSFSFVRNGRGERGKRKEKEKDSGGDITSCRTPHVPALKNMTDRR